MRRWVFLIWITKSLKKEIRPIIESLARFTSKVLEVSHKRNVDSSQTEQTGRIVNFQARSAGQCQIHRQTEAAYLIFNWQRQVWLLPRFEVFLNLLSKTHVFSQASNCHQANSVKKEAGPPANLHGAQQQTQQFISYIHPQKICSSWFTLTKHEMQNPGLAT